VSSPSPDHGVVRRIAADPGQAVVAAVSDQVVADAVADERVVARVADRPGRAGVEDEPLEAVGEHVGRQARAHRVEAAAERLADEIAGVVDGVGVVAEAPEHVVGAPAPDERVVAVAADEAVVGRVAGDDVVELVADAVPGRRALDEQEVLDVGGQGEADLSGPDGVDAAAGLLDDGVGRVDVYVEVVIGAALERVGAGAAVQDVPAGKAAERVVAAAADQQVAAVSAGDGVVASSRRIEGAARNVHEDGVAAGLVVAVVL
jgi:hypothetical protein